MNLQVEKAKAESKTGRKPFTEVTKDEREDFDAFCAELEDIADVQADLTKETKAHQDSLSLSDAIAQGDLKALRECCKRENKKEEISQFLKDFHNALQSRRRFVWLEAGIEIVTPILERGLAEARKRFEKLEADEMKEAAAVGESAVVPSAGREFLRKRINAIRSDLADPEKRLANKRCAKAFLAEHLIES